MSKIESLGTLLDADRWIERVRAQRLALPERAELHEVESRLRELLAELRHRESELRDVQALYEAAQVESTRLTTREAELMRALDASTASARDLVSMQHEVEVVTSSRGVAEDRELELLVELEPLESAVAEVRRAGEPLVGRREELRANIVALEGALDDEIRALQEQRGRLRAELSESLVTRYEKISAQLDSPGAARVLEGRCDGCRLVLAPADFDRFKHGTLDVCPSCGRLLLA